VTENDSIPLIITCDWIPPAFGAVGQYEMARARDAAASGRRVTLIGLGTDSGEETRQLGDGELTIVRIAAVAPDKGKIAKRAVWALSINRTLLRATVRAAEAYGECEIKVTGSPPFFSYLVLMRLGGNPRRRITYRVTDFYPETAFAAGRARALRPITPFIHALRRRAHRLEVLSDCQNRRIAASGVQPHRVTVSRDASPVSFDPPPRPADRPFDANEVVLLYSGNLGVAHEWRGFAEAYRRHCQEGGNRVRLWLNATGVGVEQLTAYCREHGLPVHVSPPVPLDALAGVLVAPDAHLILLGDAFWGYVFPSKTYGCLGSGRPCLYVGPSESDVHQLLIRDGGHHSARHTDVDAIVEALEALTPCWQAEPARAAADA
jgi:hypothetical protein